MFLYIFSPAIGDFFKKKLLLCGKNRNICKTQLLAAYLLQILYMKNQLYHAGFYILHDFRPFSLHFDFSHPKFLAMKSFDGKLF